MAVVVNLEGERGRSARGAAKNGLDALVALCAEDIKAVNEAILRRMHS